MSDQNDGEILHYIPDGNGDLMLVTEEEFNTYKHSSLEEQ